MAKKDEHTFLVVTDDTDFLEEQRAWLDLYIQTLDKPQHKADMGQITTPQGGHYIYMSLQMMLTKSEIDFIEQMTKS